MTKNNSEGVVITIVYLKDDFDDIAYIVWRHEQKCVCEKISKEDSVNVEFKSFLIRHKVINFTLYILAKENNYKVETNKEDANKQDIGKLLWS